MAWQRPAPPTTTTTPSKENAPSDQAEGLGWALGTVDTQGVAEEVKAWKAGEDWPWRCGRRPAGQASQAGSQQGEPSPCKATGQSAFESHPGRCMWANALGTWHSHGLISPMRTGRPGLGAGAASGPVRGQSGRMSVSRKELAPASQEPWAQASSWCCRQGDPELPRAPVQAQARGDRAQSPPMDREEEEGWGGAVGRRRC